MMWFTLSLVAIVGYILWRILMGQEENPLDKLPGPRKPIIGSVLEFVGITPRCVFLKMRKFAREYGDRYVVRILSRRILHVHNVNDVEAVLSHSKNIKKSRPYTFLEAWLGTGLLLSSGSKWHQRRKILTPTFHFNILKSFTVMIAERCRALVDQLAQSEGREVGLMPVISDFTLYTISETAMGTHIDSDKQSSTAEYKKAILGIGTLLLSRLTNVWLHSDVLFRNLPIGKRFQDCLHKVHSFADDVIIKRKRSWKPGSGDFAAAVEGIGSKRRLAMLDLLLEAESKGEIDLDGIKEEVNTFMFEGHDTTAMAIVLGLMLIADHEDVQDRIYEECRMIFGDSGRSPSMVELAEMKYLEAVIKETLRLYPSVPFIAREITEDFMLDDLLVQKGTEVAVHIYDLHRRPDLYPEPDEFRPDRFLTGQQVHPYAFVPFSAGPRNCIGQRFAMIEMKCVLSDICRRFRLAPRQRGWRPTLLADMVIRPVEPIHVRFTSR